MVLHIEGEEMGEGFEGFLIDKDNPEAGRHKGQVGRVKTSEWAYADGETKTGVQISRDIEILKVIKNLCSAIGAMKWYDAQDEKHPTIESFIEAFNSDAPYKDKWLELCIAGKEYLSKQGYTNYDMYLPKYSKGMAPFIADGGEGHLMQFDPSVHIRKTEAKPVESFGEEGEADADSVNDEEEEATQTDEEVTAFLYKFIPCIPALPFPTLLLIIKSGLRFLK